MYFVELMGELTQNQVTYSALVEVVLVAVCHELATFLLSYHQVWC